jgi:hypothetical protein
MMLPQNRLEVKVAFTHDVYTPAAIEETIRAFHELCEVGADLEGESTHLHIHVKTDRPCTICDDFLNYALELSALDLLGDKG